MGGPVLLPSALARGRRVNTGLIIACLVALVAFIRIGSFVDLSFGDILREISRGPHSDSPANTIVWQVRLPRALAVMTVGALLGSVGSAFQALLRNPLAEPYIVGVSSGAATGGAMALILGVGGWAGGLGLLGVGFLGGMMAVGLVFALARRHGNVDVNALLLAGVTVGTLLNAVLSCLLMLNGQDTTKILAFLLGHTSDMTWERVAVLAPILVVGLVILQRSTRHLNAFAMGEGVAQRAGVDAHRLSLTLLLTGTAMTAAAVGAVGIVGFIGLVAPHIARRLVGIDWRVSLMGAASVGALLMLLADLVGQRGMAWAMNQPGMEINVGIVAAIIGAPTLLILLRRTAA